MKTRNGFVSNSSSSSFVVVRKDFLDDKKEHFLITLKEEKLLVKYGFKKVGCYYANQVPDELYMIKKPPTKAYLKKLKKWGVQPSKKQKNPYFNYGYDITCNQDDVIYFLLKNNIAILLLKAVYIMSMKL